MWAAIFPGPVSAKSTIETETRALDFGTAKEGDVVRVSFPIHNTGADTVDFYRVVGSCGCSSASVSDSRLRPGETATVDVAFRTAGFPGEAHKYVTVYSSHDSAMPLLFELTGRVQPGDTGMPAAAQIGFDTFWIDVNAASETELAAAPYVGADRARAIVAMRRRRGAFTRLADLTRVPGIDSGLLDILGAFLTVRPPPRP
ncbi:MAG: hypothetical protein A3G34_06400 [Candidatus Lindowbacteria bacterium RIFCSPLOWO2_12_FULL_62_27]|nr:MAG: hypothetical protein A3G34_06400 [Candidatus Lindowbacteria bacterium RIFCSPLOWO2_12_FULL_62_27]OGH63735.1 MAG: hypothetical protein A3I06_01205 [Candidatus Lindowbacteria bacterium RIFCSPLOWO2_02_FULL_62_12]